ncbi:MAG: AAA family ATPase [Anaerolineaceae bacterium]|nr:AAA family ATPase [Anaerolineaceae bacterium]
MELLERSDVLNKMEKELQQALAGSGRFLLISGEAGIGKTSLVEQFIPRQTTRVLWGASDALFTPRPLGPLHDMAAQLRGELLSLLEGAPNRPAIFAACLQECQTPTILVFEDIHWADEATLDLLKYLGRRIQQTCSLILATYRDDELGSQHPLRLLLGDLVRHPGVERLGLTPLSLTAVRQLAKNYRGDVAQLHRMTAGNPFFINQVLTSDAEGIPATVREVVLARVSRLSLSGRAVLNAAAVIGQRIEPWLLKAVTQAEADAVEESLELGILLVQGDYFVFRHELARQAILNQVVPHQRTFLHQAVLDALKVSPAGKKDLARLAHHAEGACNQQAILTYAQAAGKEATALGMLRAATSLFALALRYADDLPLQEQIELYASYGLNTQGQDLTTSLNAFRRAAELARTAQMPVRQGLELTRMATVLYRQGKPAESERLLQEALAILEPLSPNPSLATAYRLLAMLSLLSGEAQSALAYAEEGYQMALRQEQIEVILDAYQVVGLCMMPFDHAKGLQHLEKCLGQALENKQFRVAGTNYSNLIMHGLDTFRTRWVEELLATAQPYLIAHDLDFNLSMTRAWESILRLYQGRWAESEALAEAVLKEAGPPILRIPALIARTRVFARRGEIEKARLLLDEALIQSERVGNQQRIGIYYCAAAEVAWLSGDQTSLQDLLTDFYQVTVKNKQPGFAAELAYWHWCSGTAVETFDWMVRPFIQEIHGQWREAAAAWAGMGCPYEQARALSQGDSEAQKQALALFEQLGARPMAERVRQALRDAGVEAIPRGPRSTTKENPFQLTNRQMQILALLTEELTNAEIAARLHISPKTVDHHVSAVLGKLNVASREEAAVLARTSPELRKQ